MAEPHLVDDGTHCDIQQLRDGNGIGAPAQMDPQEPGAEYPDDPRGNGGYDHGKVGVSHSLESVGQDIASVLEERCHGIDGQHDSCNFDDGRVSGKEVGPGDRQQKMGWVIR